MREQIRMKDAKGFFVENIKIDSDTVIILLGINKFVALGYEDEIVEEHNYLIKHFSIQKLHFFGIIDDKEYKNAVEKQREENARKKEMMERRRYTELKEELAELEKKFGK